MVLVPVCKSLFFGDVPEKSAACSREKARAFRVLQLDVMYRGDYHIGTMDSEAKSSQARRPHKLPDVNSRYVSFLVLFFLPPSEPLGIAPLNRKKLGSTRRSSMSGHCSSSSAVSTGRLTSGSTLRARMSGYRPSECPSLRRPPFFLLGGVGVKTTVTEY